MKQVSGYLAADGTFFEHEPEAQRHEAEQAFHLACTGLGYEGITILEIVQKLTHIIRTYIDADQACQVQECTHFAHFTPDQVEPEKRDGHPHADAQALRELLNEKKHGLLPDQEDQTDTENRTRSASPVQQFTARRPVTLSDLGRRAQSTSVSDTREGDGS